MLVVRNRTLPGPGLSHLRPEPALPPARRPSPPPSPLTSFPSLCCRTMRMRKRDCADAAPIASYTSEIQAPYPIKKSGLSCAAVQQRSRFCPAPVSLPAFVVLGPPVRDDRLLRRGCRWNRCDRPNSSRSEASQRLAGPANPDKGRTSGVYDLRASVSNDPSGDRAAPFFSVPRRPLHAWEQSWHETCPQLGRFLGADCACGYPGLSGEPMSEVRVLPTGNVCTIVAISAQPGSHLGPGSGSRNVEQETSGSGSCRGSGASRESRAPSPA